MTSISEIQIKYLITDWKIPSTPFLISGSVNSCLPVVADLWDSGVHDGHDHFLSASQRRTFQRASRSEYGSSGHGDERAHLRRVGHLLDLPDPAVLVHFDHLQLLPLPH